uniref:Uncharacterized protein n=1 Tax=Panagrolaimus superbus TaxID=310955 RepID=A0A914Y0E4_9BILA
MMGYGISSDILDLGLLSLVKNIGVGKHKSRHEELREEAFVEKYRASRKKAKRNRSEKLPNGIHIGGMRYAKIVNNGTAVCIRDFYITSYGTYEPFNEGLVFDTRGIRYLKHSLPDLKKLFKP